MVLLLLAAAQAMGAPPVIIPPKAAEIRGAIEQVTIGPIFAAPFSCTEHPMGQLPFAGDALGTDCVVTGGLKDDAGFSSPYRGEGAANSDWYGWDADVLSPVAGTVVGLFVNPASNTPGAMGRPPASMIQIKTSDQVLVTLAHGRDFSVKIGDPVSAGQAISKVGNNGMSRAPHIHVGAYRLADSMPLQIRWDLRAMASLQGAGTGRR